MAWITACAGGGAPRQRRHIPVCMCLWWCNPPAPWLGWRWGSQSLQWSAEPVEQTPLLAKSTCWLLAPTMPRARWGKCCCEPEHCHWAGQEVQCWSMGLRIPLPHKAQSSSHSRMISQLLQMAYFVGTPGITQMPCMYRNVKREQAVSSSSFILVQQTCIQPKEFSQGPKEFSEKAHWSRTGKILWLTASSHPQPTAKLPSYLHGI